jgi:protease PrsW
MMLAFTAVSALIPSILLAWYFYSRDLQPEPARAVWATFGLGVLSIIPTLLVDWPISAHFVNGLSDPFAIGTAEAFCVAAIPEEFFKFSVLYWYSRRRKWFDEPMDGVVYGATAALGFATLENILYCLQGNLYTALFRAFTAVPGHAFWGAIMGYYVGIAQFSPKAERPKWLLRALAWPMLMHGLYDAPLLCYKTFAERKIEPSSVAQTVLIVGMVGSLAIVVLGWVQGIRLTRRMRRAQAFALASVGPAAQAAIGAYPAAPTAPANIVALAAIWPREALLGSALPQAALALADGPKPSAPLGWLFMLLGGLLANAGALVLAAVTISLAGSSGADWSAAIGALVILGALPLGLGLWLFSAGLRRLPKATPFGRVAPYPTYPTARTN